MKDILARPLLWKDYGKSSSYSNLGLKRRKMVYRLPSPSPDCDQVVEWTNTGIENAYLGDTIVKVTPWSMFGRLLLTRRTTARSQSLTFDMLTGNKRLQSVVGITTSFYAPATFIARLGSVPIKLTRIKSCSTLKKLKKSIFLVAINKSSRNPPASEELEFSIHRRMPFTTSRVPWMIRFFLPSSRETPCRILALQHCEPRLTGGY
jgi:hypothetical protein